MTFDILESASSELRNGNLVVIPTETVYGLAADATNDAAVSKIYALKNRPDFNPLIVHFDTTEQANTQVTFNNHAYKLAEKFWPGPLTLVLMKRPKSNISLLVSAGLDTVAVRIPDHPLTLRLINFFGGPVAAPSANPSNYISPTTADHVKTFFSHLLLPILDGGPCQVGIESTIVDISTENPVLLRKGKICAEEIAECLGMSMSEPMSASIKAPGMMKKHYSPQKPLRINVTEPRNDEAFIDFGCPKTAHAFYNISEKGCLIEAASNLFRALFDADKSPWGAIAIAPIPNEGIGRAINDRLTRASSH